MLSHAVGMETDYGKTSLGNFDAESFWLDCPTAVCRLHLAPRNSIAASCSRDWTDNTAQGLRKKKVASEVVQCTHVRHCGSGGISY